jgi:uncharacterized membrane protein YgcG
MARTFGVILLTLFAGIAQAVCPQIEYAEQQANIELAKCQVYPGVETCRMFGTVGPAKCPPSYVQDVVYFHVEYRTPGSPMWRGWTTHSGCCLCGAEKIPPAGLKLFHGETGDEACQDNCKYIVEKLGVQMLEPEGWYGRGLMKPTGESCVVNDPPPEMDDEDPPCEPGDICSCPGGVGYRAQSGELICTTVDVPNCETSPNAAICVGPQPSDPPPPPNPPIPPDTPPVPDVPDVQNDDGDPSTPPIVVNIDAYEGEDDDGGGDDGGGDDGGGDDGGGDDGGGDDGGGDDGGGGPGCLGVHCGPDDGICATNPSAPECDNDGDGTGDDDYCEQHPNSSLCNNYCRLHPEDPFCGGMTCNPRIQQCGDGACQMNPGAPGCSGFCTAHPDAIGCDGFCDAHPNAAGCGTDGICNPATENCGQCVNNPQAPGCDDGDDDGPCDPETEDCDSDGEVSGGYDCDAAPSCSGDEILCSSLHQQWELRCMFVVEEDDDDSTPPERDDVIDVADVNPLDFLPLPQGGASCPDLGEIAAFGVSMPLDPAGQWCQLFEVGRMLIMLIAAYTSARIFAGGA